MQILRSIGRFFANMLYMAKRSAKLAPSEYLFSLVTMVTEVLPPFAALYFSKTVLDTLSTGGTWRRIVWELLIWTGAGVSMKLLRALSDGIGNVYFNKVAFRGDKMWADLRAGMDYAKLEQGEIADRENRLRENLRFGNFSSYPLGEFLTAAFKLAGYTYVIASLHPVFVLCLLALTLLRSKLSKARQARDFRFRKEIRGYARREKYLFSVLAGYSFAKEIRIGGAHRWVSEKYKAETADYLRAFRKDQKRAFRTDAAGSLLTFLQNIAIYGYSAFRVVTKSISVGSFSVYLGAVTAFSGSFSDLMDKIQFLRFYAKYIEEFRAYERLARPSRAEDESCPADPKGGGHEIRFENVSFKYPQSEQYVLKNVSISLRSGERLAFVGRNGAGKSTFIKLLCRLYAPTSGKILYNGTDIQEIVYAQYRRLLSAVFQDFDLYAMSVKENVCTAFGYDGERFRDAVKKSGLAEKVKSLPLGEETQVGKEFDEKGIAFSGGEGQKLALARAVYKDAPVMILDEPTASLDPMAERALYERSKDVMGGKTAVFISHRLASVKFCDRAAVFDCGRIVEYGSHAELLEKGGLYAKMYRKQAESYLEEEENEKETGDQDL